MTSIPIYHQHVAAFANFDYYSLTTARSAILDMYPHETVFDLVTEGKITGSMPAVCMSCLEVTQTFPLTRDFVCTHCGSHKVISLDLISS